MEAATGGAPAAAPNQSAQLQQAVDNLSTAVTDMQQRVNQDLENLKNQVNEANQASPAVDLTSIITTITTIQNTVTSIDPAEAAQGGAAGSQEPASTTATAAPDATAPAATGDQGQVGDSSTPEAAAGGAATAARTVYTFDGDPSTVDASQWPRADVNTEDGRLLFYYAGDTNLGDANGDGQGGVWHRYDGPQVAAGLAADTGGAAPSGGGENTAPGA